MDPVRLCELTHRCKMRVSKLLAYTYGGYALIDQVTVVWTTRRASP